MQLPKNAGLEVVDPSKPRAKRAPKPTTLNAAAEERQVEIRTPSELVDLLVSGSSPFQSGSSD